MPIEVGTTKEINNRWNEDARTQSIRWRKKTAELRKSSGLVCRISSISDPIETPRPLLRFARRVQGRSGRGS